jgi:putative component of membrane protein insertase Oxa1/YidC/SpoIIIJ protein YidD
MQAIERHGARHGSALAIKRLLRCHPFSPGGVDLVPDADTFVESAEVRQ